MPKYDVKCQECDYEEEVTHKISENHKPCSKCGGVVYTFFPQGTVLNAPKLVGAGWTRKIKKYKPSTYKPRGE